MKKRLEARISEAISSVERARKSKHAFGLLPDISRLLFQMQASVAATAEDRQKLAGGLGRLVTDNYEFSESQLGNRLLDLANDFAPLER